MSRPGPRHGLLIPITGGNERRRKRVARRMIPATAMMADVIDVIDVIDVMA